MQMLLSNETNKNIKSIDKRSVIKTVLCTIFHRLTKSGHVHMASEAVGSRLAVCLGVHTTSVGRRFGGSTKNIKAKNL